MALSTSPAARELTPQQKAFTLIGVLLGLFLAALDQTIVATAGPAIQLDLHIEASLYAWLTTSYLVTSTAMVPLYGKLSDLYGRKPVLVAGITLFLIGSFLCGIARATPELILYRALQGLGSAALFTTAFAVVADMFPPAERGKYQGAFGAVFGLSSVVGPLVGGFITDHFGWHWVFFVNIPVGAAALLFIFLRMPRLLPHRERRPRVDVLGAGLLLIAVVPLLLALSLGHSEGTRAATGYPWLSWQVLGLFALAAVGTVLFVAVEKRVSDPILDLSLFSNRTFAIGTAACFVLGAAFLAAIVFLPLFMVNVVGFSATRAGLTVMPLTLGIVAANVLSGQLVSRLGRYKGVLLASILLMIVAFALMGFTLSAESSQLEVTVKMVLLGLGLGPAIPLFPLAVQNAVAPEQVGVATSSVTFARQLGSTVGVAILGAVFAVTLTQELGTRMSASTRGLPPALRARMQAAGAGHGEGQGAVAFPGAQIRESVRRSFAEQRARGGDHESLQLEEVTTLKAVDASEHAFREGFTVAVARIYRFALLIAVLGLLLTLALPALPLRRGH